jgi:hypothetical protein
MPWYSAWSGTWPGQTSETVWKSNMDDERILSLEDMPGWEKYKPNVSDSGTTRIADRFYLRGESTIMGVYDMNGHYMGASTQNLPQGRYIVRSRVQGRMVNAVYLKK